MSPRYSTSCWREFLQRPFASSPSLSSQLFLNADQFSPCQGERSQRNSPLKRVDTALPLCHLGRTRDIADALAVAITTMLANSRVAGPAARSAYRPDTTVDLVSLPDRARAVAAAADHRTPRGDAVACRRVGVRRAGCARLGAWIRELRILRTSEDCSGPAKRMLTSGHCLFAAGRAGNCITAWR